MAGKITDGSNGDVGVDSYHRYEEDVGIMKEIGLDAYRFSISWPRVLPYGKISGGVNNEGIEYYNNLINELLKKGIKPYVTLFHWDLPQALDDEYGGFLSHEIVEDYKDYADLCFQKFGERVKHWITFNEPWLYTIKGYALGVTAPGRCSSWLQMNCTGGDSGTEPYIVGHHQLLAHAATSKLYKQKYQALQKGEIGITLVTHWMVPFSEARENQNAALRALDFMFGGWVPVLNKNRKQSGASFHKLFTLFVDNLLEDVSQNWLRKTYSQFGSVKDVFIPSKRSKVTGTNFGFVKYDSENSAKSAIEKTNGIWIEDKKLFVKMASFDKRHEYLQQKPNISEPSPRLASTSKKGEVKSAMPNVWSRINRKSFAQVVKGDAVGKIKEDALEKEWLLRRKVLVCTASIAKLDGWIQMEIGESIHRIKVTEEVCLQPDLENIQKSWTQTDLKEDGVGEREDGDLAGIDPFGRRLFYMSKEVVVSSKQGESKTHEEGDETSNILKMAQLANGGLQAEFQGDTSNSMGLLNSRVEDSFISNQVDCQEVVVAKSVEVVADSIENVADPIEGGSDWLSDYPRGIYDTLHYIKKKYNNPPIYITENGCNELDNATLSLEEALDDKKRVDYFYGHLSFLLQAIKEGANVKGYFAWSLLDNFEWMSGYTLRFGINYVDFNDGLKRYPKLSAKWFKNFLKQEDMQFELNDFSNYINDFAHSLE
ncbi:hypothetical protein Vadar_030471 [Vaccinium darrowii]|uniref:Uncharacterized protein n=1 Tax=Vaccinium darrowii TaxID=229202 RepID=A0ACB7XD69_9ERIC|nr:hypothetical protein Vadar_030471 [Vaccinium darrowii]